MTVRVRAFYAPTAMAPLQGMCVCSSVSSSAVELRVLLCANRNPLLPSHRHRPALLCAKATILPVLPVPVDAKPSPALAAAPAPPLVVAHGMGDSCFNPGMKQITAEGGKRVNAYSVCIPTGNNDIEDTINGFLLNLDKSIDVFAAKVSPAPPPASNTAHDWPSGQKVFDWWVVVLLDVTLHNHI